MSIKKRRCCTWLDCSAILNSVIAAAIYELIIKFSIPTLWAFFSIRIFPLYSQSPAWLYILVIFVSFIAIVLLSIYLSNITKRELLVCNFPVYNHSADNYYIYTFTTDSEGNYISVRIDNYFISPDNKLYLSKFNSEITSTKGIFSFIFNLKGVSGNFTGYNKDKNVMFSSVSYFCTKCNENLKVANGYLYRLCFFDRINFILKFKIFSFRKIFSSYSSKKRKKLEFEYCQSIKYFFDKKEMKTIIYELEM